MSSADAALGFYRAHLGAQEQPPGSNCVPGLTDWYGMGCVPWCAITASRALVAAGFTDDHDTIALPAGLRSSSAKGWAYCPYMVNDFRAAGLWGGDAYPGALVLYDWTGDGVADHVGIVEAVVGDGSIVALEGNTGNNVLERRRRSSGLILGFAYPPYDGAVPGNPAVPEGMLGRGSTGEGVELVQRALAGHGYALDVDGDFGPATEAAVRAFQSDRGLEVDGIVGPATFAELGRAGAPAAVVVGDLDRVLYLRAPYQTGDDVRLLQARLTERGHGPGPVDGVFGPATRRAVLSFQTEAGVAVDGAVGPITWGALFA